MNPTLATGTAGGHIGARADGGIEYWPGSIGEVLIYNGALSAAQQQAVEAYLNYEWRSSTASLPPTTSVQIGAGATLDLAGNSQQVASLSDLSPGQGGSIISSSTASSSVLTLGSTGGVATFSGAVNGGGGLGAISLVMSGPGTQVLAGVNSYSGRTTISGGALQVIDGVGLPARSNLTLSGNLAQYGYGAVLQSTGTFSRTVGSTADQLQWAGDGGFAANGGRLTVSMSPGVPLVWGNNTLGTGTGGFVPDGSALTFGSPTANNQVNFTDSIDMNGEVRQIDVAAGAGGDSTLISGNIFDSQSGGGLLKTGGGNLILSGSNTYGGPTIIAAGTLTALSNTALPNGSSLTIAAGGTLVFDPAEMSTGSPVSDARAVPEPGTLLLMAAAGSIMAWRRKWLARNAVWRSRHPCSACVSWSN
jgi:autotransporter-associated beta strand protein